LGWLGRCGRKGKRKKGLPAWDLAGWARRKGRERGGGKGLVLFFLKILSNSFFKHSNSNQTKIHAFKS
jgi:hypothetical protein